MQNKEKEPMISMSEFRQLLFEPVIPLEEVEDYKREPMSKIMPYWRKRGLVPFVAAGKHRVKISSADLMWLMMLDIMRRFSYPIEMQEKVRDYFFADAYRDQVPQKNFRYNQELLNKKKLAGTITAREEATLQFIEHHLKDKVLLEAMRCEINYLTNLITDCLESEEDRTVLIFGDGRVAERHGPNYYTHSDFVVDPLEPHLAISIKHLLQTFIQDEELSHMVMPQLLNENELLVLKAIKEKNMREVVISVNGKKDMVISVTKAGVLTKEDAKKVREALGLRNYERITFDTIDEKSISFKKTMKHINK